MQERHRFSSALKAFSQILLGGENPCAQGPTFSQRNACVESGFPRTPFCENAVPCHRERPSPILEAMEVHFTPEQEARLVQIAATAGTDPERLVKDAVLRLLQEDAHFRAAVREGIAQADRGEFIEGDEMDARLEQMLRS
jgi:predicted transcriptional regulator